MLLRQVDGVIIRHPRLAFSLQYPGALGLDQIPFMPIIHRRMLGANGQLFLVSRHLLEQVLLFRRGLLRTRTQAHQRVVQIKDSG